MDRVDAGRVCAVAALLGLSAAVLQFACLRSSTIYFFELETTRVLFLDIREAIIFPIGLSLVLAFFYLLTKRVFIVDEERKAALSVTSSSSAIPSRKISRSGDLPVIREEADARVLKRLLTEIKEDHSGETSASHSGQDLEEEKRKSSSDEDATTKEESKDEEQPKVELTAPDEPSPPGSSTHSSPKPSKSSKNQMDLPEEPVRRAHSESRTFPPSTGGSTPVTFATHHSDSEEDDGGIARRRTSSTPAPDARLRLFQQDDNSRRSSRKNSVERELTDEQRCEIYKSIGQMDVLSFSLSFLNLLPLESKTNVPPTYSTEEKLRLRLGDVLAELLAVHLPIWASVAALHVLVLELIRIKFAYYFYYHEETMAYTALVASCAFGLLHEFSGGWATSDVLALSHVYVIVSRVQAVSFQSGMYLLIGMALFDLFWLYVIDLLSTVTTRSRAPLMLQIPRDNAGNKQSLATLDLIVPGIYLNILLKYSSMYDPGLYLLSFEAIIGGLLLTCLIAIYRRRVTPAMVLPGALALAVGYIFSSHPNDLWRFVVKH